MPSVRFLTLSTFAPSSVRAGRVGAGCERNYRRHQWSCRGQHGAILPGVTVTLASPSMMGTRTAITTAEGQYRFPAIPPASIS